MAAFGLPGCVKRHSTVSPTCAGTLRGVQIVRNVGVSKAWIGRVTAAEATDGAAARATSAPDQRPADHATTSI